MFTKMGHLKIRPHLQNNDNIDNDGNKHDNNNDDNNDNKNNINDNTNRGLGPTNRLPEFLVEPKLIF